jgi:phenylacetate-coenzyme A ligase PaaK-like adenylate-forming protein
VAARERDIGLSGVSFFVSGEPITQTKADEIKSSGADVVPYYAFAEGGIVAHGCANPGSADDMHILRDRIAVITHKKKPIYSNKTVDALLFTSLLPESPKILLNVETGDHGSINSRKCGCKFGDYGLSDHISNVRSFEKTTSEGMTFMVSDLIRIVEDVLPVRYGGSSTDYQVLEESNGLGSSFINIAVSPRLGPINHNDLKKVVIRELGKGEDSKRLMAQVWFDADTIKVTRMEPVPTKRGKIFPFRGVGM